MTQRIFDVENEKDMQDLWNILPDDIEKLSPIMGIRVRVSDVDYCSTETTLLAINWHDKTEITRPVPEATEQDIGKLCVFWDKNINAVSYDKLLKIDERYNPYKYETSGEGGFIHCRRLTKQEIEELC